MKKALALFLVLVLSLGMTTTAFAFKAPILNEWDSTVVQADIETFNPDDFAPGEDISVPFEIDWFTSVTWAAPYTTNWEAGKFATQETTSLQASPTSLDNYPVFKKDINSGRFSVRSKVKKGAVCIDEVKIDYASRKYEANDNGTSADLTTTYTDVAHLFVSMVDPFPSLTDIDFEVEVYGYIDGKAYPRESVIIAGNLSNDTDEITKDTYYAYMADGTVYEVKDYVKEVEYELMDDGGVILVGPAIKGQKYWAVADNNNPTAAESDIMDEYGIEEIIKIKALGGLDRASKHVLLDIANPSDYVYDGSLNYLGRASDPLDFSNVYYLSSTLLDVEGEIEPEEEVEEDEEIGDDYELPSESGGEGYLDNVNDNPGTGK